MSNSNTSLQEVLARHFEYATSQMYTAIPGIIISVDDLAQQRVTVQPVINLRTDDLSTDVQRPPIVNVPIHMPITSQGGLNLPIKPKDSVMLIFSMRGLTLWKNSNGGFSPPDDMRSFDVKDCIAIPGIVPFSLSPNNPNKRRGEHSVNDVTLVHNIGTANEVSITLAEGGGIKISANTDIKVYTKDNVEMDAEEIIFKTNNFEVRERD